MALTVVDRRVLRYYTIFCGIGLNDLELDCSMPPWTKKVSPLRMGWFSGRNIQLLRFSCQRSVILKKDNKITK
jgi:hypothetical protein